MKRRDFIKTTAAAGFTGIVGKGCSVAGKNTRRSDYGFDVHPFVRNHPEAVFIHKTSVKSKRETAGMHDAGYTLAKELIVRTGSGGYPYSTEIIVKPNWTSTQQINGKPVYEKLGVNTDPYFIEGWIQGMRQAGPERFYLRDSSKASCWEPMGYYKMAARNNVDLRDLATKDFWDLKKEDINFVKIPDGVIFKEVGYIAPVNEPGAFLVNIAKFKAHGMGITATIKNLQGVAARKFKNFCTRYDQVRKTSDARYHKFFKEDFEKHIKALHAKHLKEGIPRWDRPGAHDGIWMETWVQRALDSLSVTPTGLNIVEGVYSQDGNGFGKGPHEKIGSVNVTSRDYMSNVVIFGIDPFRVDIITHWLAGHEPGNFGLFHIGIERGMSDVLDPHDIPVYFWENGRATLTSLENLTRTPLVTNYLRRDYNGQKEPLFHLCDEPFDYSAWKAGKRAGDCSPSIRNLGRDAHNKAVMEMEVAERENVCVDVLNAKGEVVWRLIADDLEPGVHQVVWDGFDQPGLYTFYLKGMGWDTEKKEVVFT